jgi:hypothetical protein
LVRIQPDQREKPSYPQNRVFQNSTNPSDDYRLVLINSNPLYFAAFLSNVSTPSQG